MINLDVQLPICFDVESRTYKPSLWTPSEIETATGNSDCTFLEHSLPLRSTYIEVKVNIKFCCHFFIGTNCYISCLCSSRKYKLRYICIITVSKFLLSCRSSVTLHFTFLQHCPGTRDPNGEPLATSYHRCFLGTVDYIW